MTLSAEQANWFGRTYDQLVGNVEVAVASDGRSQLSDPSSGERIDNERHRLTVTRWLIKGTSTSTSDPRSR
jgi:hypothetical protein